MPLQTFRNLRAVLVVAALLAGSLMVVTTAGPAQAAEWPASVSGTLRDKHQDPAVGVSVTLTNTSNGSTWTDVTDEAGQYGFADLWDVGPYTLTTTGSWLPWSKRWAETINFGAGGEQFELNGEDVVRDGRIARPTWIMISGRDGDGNVVGLESTAVTVGDSKTTCAREDVPPVDDTVFYLCRQGGTVRLDLRANYKQRVEGFRTDTIATSYGDVVHKEYVFPALRKVTGRVVDGKGRPLKGAETNAADPCSYNTSNTTNSKGAFSFYCPANQDAAVSVASNSLSHVDLRRTFSVGATDVKLGDIRMRTAAQVRATFHTDKGKALPYGSCVQSYRRSGGAWVRVDQKARVGKSTTVGGLPEGSYRFLASACRIDSDKQFGPVSNRERRWVASGKTYTLKAGRTTALPDVRLRSAYKTSLTVKAAPPATSPGRPKLTFSVKATGTGAAPTGTFFYELERSSGEDIEVRERTLTASRRGTLTFTGPQLAPGSYRVGVFFTGSGRFQDVRYPVRATLVVPAAG